MECLVTQMTVKDLMKGINEQARMKGQMCY